MVYYEYALAFANIQTAVLLFIFIVLLFWFFKSSSNTQIDRFPPGPYGWPVVGSILQIEKEAYLTFDKWRKEYGGFYTVNLGWGKRVLFLTSTSAVKCVLKDQGDKVTRRFTLPVIKLGFTIPGSIIFEEGHVWNERRRWILGFLRVYSLAKNNVENKINLEADYLCQEFDKQVDSFNPLDLVNNAVSNIICTVSFGDRFEYTDAKFKKLVDGTRYIFAFGSLVSLANVFPFLLYTPLYKHFRDTVDNLKSFVNEVIQQHENTFQSDHIRDVIDAYILESRKEDADLEVFGMDLLWRTLLDMFFAGTDTTTITIMWVILYMVNYPEVQKKVQQEIDDVLGQGKAPSWNDRHSMPFLEATVMEVQRLCNVAAVVVRATTEEINIEGYKIPAGTSVLASLWSVHRNSDDWDSPLDFKPERFLTDDLKAIQRKDAFMPFGAGRRVCVGELLARMELFLFTANLMQRFTFKMANGEKFPSENECDHGLTRSPKPYKVMAIKR